MWFGYDIQNTCGFHLGFHWVSKLMHMTNLAIFYWLSNLWIINEFWNMNFKVHPLSIEEVVTSFWLLQLWYLCYVCTLSTIFLGEKCGNFPEIYNIKSVYILQTFCAYLCRFYLDYIWSPCLFFIVILQRKWQDFANISFNKMCTFYRHLSELFCNILCSLFI